MDRLDSNMLLELLRMDSLQQVVCASVLAFGLTTCIGLKNVFKIRLTRMVL